MTLSTASAEHRFDLDFRYEAHLIFGAAINFSVTLLPALSLHPPNRQPLDPAAVKGLANLFEFELLMIAITIFMMSPPYEFLRSNFDRSSTCSRAGTYERDVTVSDG